MVALIITILNHRYTNLLSSSSLLSYTLQSFPWKLKRSMKLLCCLAAALLGPKTLGSNADVVLLPLSSFKTTGDDEMFCCSVAISTQVLTPVDGRSMKLLSIAVQ
jgi:hypothetical protein